MKLNLVERLIVNNPLRALSQRYIEVPFLKKMAGKDSYPVCLEIGCGRGTGAQMIARLFKAETVFAIDIDEKTIELARKRTIPDLKEIIEFRVGDAMDLKWPDETFDAVFSLGVLHHLEDWQKGIREISRVLKKGGELFFEEPLRSFLEFPLVRLITKHPEGGLFSMEEFKKGIENADMYIKKLKTINSIAIAGVARKTEP